MKKLTAVLAIIMILLAFQLCGCGDSKSGTVRYTAPANAVNSASDIVSLLLSNYAAVNKDGHSYYYEEINTMEVDETEYYIFRQYSVTVTDGEAEKEIVGYIFASFDGEYCYKGVYNEQSGQYKWEEKIDLLG